MFLASQASSYVTGQILAIDGGFSVFGYAPPDGTSYNENFVSGAFEETKKKKRRKDPNAPKTGENSVPVLRREGKNQTHPTVARYETTRDHDDTWRPMACLVGKEQKNVR